jgi:hypothetical protein
MPYDETSVLQYLRTTHETSQRLLVSDLFLILRRSLIPGVADSQEFWGGFGRNRSDEMTSVEGV